MKIYPQDSVLGNLCKEKKQKYPKVVYKALLRKLTEKNDAYIIKIERDDGKSITSYAYHMSEEYLQDESNWL